MDVGPIWLVGCGNMGGALLDGWLSQGLDPNLVTVVDPVSRETASGVVQRRDIPAAAPPAAVLVLAVKPQTLQTLAPSLRRLVGPDTMILSVLAAVEIATLKDCFPQAATIVRAVPNLPAAIGRGITALVAAPRSPKVERLAQALCAPLGEVVWLEAEAQCDAVTAAAGCGPAYLFRFADAMIKAAIDLGLPASMAARLVKATVSGSAELMIRSDDPPSRLAARVASPGGVTLEGLKVLDGDAALDILMERTLKAAADRSARMARDLAFDPTRTP